MKTKLIILLLLLIAVAVFFGFCQLDKPIDKTVHIDKILVEKSKRKLHLFSGEKIIKSYNISIGRNPIGHKEFEGDKKTPEGNYFINDKNPNSGYYKNLGVSYPNEKDIENAKSIGKSPGGQIKIHGLKNGLGWISRFHLLLDWTAGCIAVTNKDIDEIYDIIEIGIAIEIRE